MKYFILVALLVVMVFIIWLCLPKKSYKERCHRRKINNAKKVLKTFERFTGDYRNAQIITYLRKIDPYVFEELLLEAFEIKGYIIKRNKSYSYDGGMGFL